MTDVTLETLSGPVPAILTGGDSSRHIAVLGHGIFVDREENGRFPRLAERLLEHQIASVRPNLPGHGTSPIPSRETTVAIMALTLRDTIDWSLERFATVSVVASSFAGALFSLVADAAMQSALARVVMLNPVLDLRNVFIEAEMPEMRELFNVDSFARAYHDGFFEPTSDFEMSREFLFELSHIDVPSAYQELRREHLVLHGTADELVSFRRASEIAALNASASFVAIPGGVHAFTQSGHESQIWDRVVEYLLD
jgi:uncharacterized protein